MAGHPWGGSEELWVKLASRLNEEANQVYASVYDWGELPIQIEKLKEEGITIHTRKRIAYNSISKKIVAKIRQNTIAKSQLHSFVKQTNPELIIISMGSFADLEINPFRNFIFEISVPYILIVHANPASHRVEESKRKEVKLVSEKAKSVWFVSKRLREIAERQIAYTFSNSEIVVNPVNMDSTTYLEYPKNGFVQFAVVGRLAVDVKGHALLLQILSKDNWKERNWHLNIWGTGPDEDLIKELVELYGLQNKVSLKGFTNNIREDIWSKNHILLMPSYYEGLPIALMEAMLCGRTAVATDVGGNIEVLTDGVDGYIAEGTTILSFSKALDKAWQNKGDWEEKGKIAHENASEYFGGDPMGGLTKLILRDEYDKI